MKNDIHQQIAEGVRRALKQIGADLSLLRPQLDLPSDSRFGELSSNIALQLSKKLNRPPREIAEQLALALRGLFSKRGLKLYIQEVKVEGAGFINFYLTRDYFYAFLKDILKNKEKALRSNSGAGEKVLVEFVSANPTGSLSVAHARQAAVGDALANILGFCGWQAKREYYLNDEGNQINILGRSIGLRLKELKGEKIEFPEDHYQGDYIRDIARHILENKIEAKELSRYGADYILEVIRKELEDFGVRFDYWASQKALRESGKIEKALKFLKKKGLLYGQEGALWFASTKFGDDKDRVVVKSDGSYTYLAPDIAYHQDKLRRGFGRMVNLLGPDHHGYIGRLKAAVAAFGKDPDALSVIIVQLATIFRAGKPVQMSTRRGQYITLREVLDEVGKDAARFFFLMRKTSSHLDFDLEVAKKQTPENPVYYVQYAHARICNILKNLPAGVRMGSVQLRLLKEKAELELIKKQWQFPWVLEACVAGNDPYLLTVYLQELAAAFHKFYDLHRVLIDDRQLCAARLSLVEATRIVLASGLRLLGVSHPEKM